jgi:DNA segregation ATPase FtsK/SpoIIIE and related proteins
VDTWKERVSHAATYRWGPGSVDPAALHRRAAATADAAAGVLETIRSTPAGQREQHELAERLRAAASRLAPGWLGAPLDAQSASAPLGGPGLPAFVRVGVAQPLDDARFPVVVPLLGTGHLTIDADSRDVRVAGLLQAVLLRLLAAAPPGSLLVRGVDAATEGQLFASFAPLADAGLMPPPATDQTGLRAVLTEAEQWVRPVRPTATRCQRHDRTLLLVIGSLPELTEGEDLTRIGALARRGPEAGLHLLVAGWPPPPLTEETTQPPLPRSTMISVRNPYALVGDPPGGSFTAPGAQPPPAGLNAPVFLDDAPPPTLVDRVCRDLAARLDPDYRHTLADLLPESPERLWAERAADGLSTPVGHDGDRIVTLGFDDRTPHWLVSGRAGAGKSAFLVNVLYGLCARYHPDELVIYLIDFAEGAAFAEFVPAERGSDPVADGFLPENEELPRDDESSAERSWLPHVRAVGIEADREYGLAVLRELDAELDRRTAAAGPAGADTPGVDPAAGAPTASPRIVCLLDEYPVLLAGDDAVAAEALTRLESVARRGRAAGVHLILSSRPTAALAPLRDRRDSVFAQFPVRVALPGGTDVLEAANDAAAGLPLGSAVVNTAGGLGGPRGVTRGHERVVRFPDPHADEEALTALRRRLWARRPASAPAPVVFTGYLAPPRPEEPPTLADRAADGAPVAVPAPRAADATEVATGVSSGAGTATTPDAGEPAPTAGPVADRVGAAPAATAAEPVAPVDVDAASGGEDPRSARALLGRVVDVPLRMAAVPLDPAPGRHLAVLGPGDAGADVLDAAARNLALQHPAGSVRFVIAALAEQGRAVADALGADLARRHRVERIDGGDLSGALEQDRPAYLVVFGMDEWRGEDLPPERFRAALHNGPARGLHLISWWRAASRFAARLAAGSNPGSRSRSAEGCEPPIDNLVFLDVPEREVEMVLGRTVPWRPRPGRALLYDRRTERATLIVPFAARRPRRTS